MAAWPPRPCCIPCTSTPHYYQTSQKGQTALKHAPAPTSGSRALLAPSQPHGHSAVRYTQPAALAMLHRCQDRVPRAAVNPSKPRHVSHVAGRPTAATVCMYSWTLLPSSQRTTGLAGWLVPPVTINPPFPQPPLPLACTHLGEAAGGNGGRHRVEALVS